MASATYSLRFGEKSITFGETSMEMFMYKIIKTKKNEKLYVSQQPNFD